MVVIPPWIPHFVLANRLYRGAWPKEFWDITWIEEMVYDIFRTTANVACLYESSKQPFVYHGNSCAHKVTLFPPLLSYQEHLEILNQF